jgi:hypothetical protein
MEVEPRTEQYEEAGPLLLEEEPVFVGSLTPSAIPPPLTEQENATPSSEVSTAAEGSHQRTEPAEIPQELLERAVADTAERVVTRLAKDMAEKLGERIEQIVREVVPALAENLIVKEIERIKASIEAKPAE